MTSDFGHPTRDNLKGPNFSGWSEKPGPWNMSPAGHPKAVASKISSDFLKTWSHFLYSVCNVLCAHTTLLTTGIPSITTNTILNPSAVRLQFKYWIGAHECYPFVSVLNVFSLPQNPESQIVPWFTPCETLLKWLGQIPLSVTLL